MHSGSSRVAESCFIRLYWNFDVHGCLWVRFENNSERYNTGGFKSPASSSQPPTPPAPSPNPAPVPTSDSYLATISSTTGTNPTSNGTVTIDTATNGAGTLQITGLAVSNGELQFCPGGVNSTCTNIAPVTTDAGGNATVNFTFPEKGTFSGVWQIVMSDCSSGWQIAASSTGDTGANFMSAELPAGNISGGIGQTTGDAPGSGTLTVNGTTAHLVLNGTTASHTFNVAVCAAPQPSNCTQLSSVTTDANGNANTDVGTVQPFGWSVFTVSDSGGVEFISAFRVQ